jgi:hypothetical protein
MLLHHSQFGIRNGSVDVTSKPLQISDNHHVAYYSLRGLFCQR